MLLTHDQCKYLEADGDKNFRYVGHGIATEAEKQELLELDEYFLAVYQEHIITNWDEIK